ncbi:MAG: biopolymer transporter ExbD [Gammaproteobacteria bacterium]
MNFRSHSADESDLGVELTPLIDVVFLLLIFFMVSSSFKDETQLALDLPESSAEAASVPKSLQVVISADGNYHVNGTLVEHPDIDSLKSALSNAASGRTDPTVVISADRHASHGDVVAMLEAARQLNYLNISFTAERNNVVE